MRNTWNQTKSSQPFPPALYKGQLVNLGQTFENSFEISILHLPFILKGIAATHKMTTISVERH